MATDGTAYEGIDSLIVPAVYTGLDLRLYTNTGDSLTKSSVLATLTYPVGTGYATLSLAGVWSSNNGVVTYDDGTPDDPSFTNTSGGDWTGDVVGAAITDGTYLLHWRDFSTGAFTVIDTQTITIDISTLVG
jgi:hypothetical protein